MEAIEIVMASTVALAQNICNMAVIEGSEVSDELFQVANIPARHVSRRETKEGITYFIINDHDRTR